MKKRLGIILLMLVLVQFTAVNMFSQDKREREKDLSPEDLQELEDKLEIYFSRKSVVSTINSLLMAYIMWFYYMMYRENKSKFSLGLIALSGALLVYSISSNPWIVRQFWYIFKREFEYKYLFDFIPELFTTAAAVIMIYLTRT
jgi:hypothetical protein